MMHSTRAVFLDRDGTLVRDFRHGADPAAVRLLPGVGAALRALGGAGYQLVVVTNQSGVARGLFSLGEARKMGRRIAALVSAEGARLDGYYFCPHHPEGSVEGLAGKCECRKPEAGMLLRAAQELRLDLRNCWMVGDHPTDVDAGYAAGTRAVLIDIGAKGLDGEEPAPPLIARNLAHAAALIMIADGRLTVDVAPCCPQSMDRVSAMAGRRGTGEPNPWPGETELDAAVADGRMLEEATRHLVG